jgi:hypothetical protein
LLQYSSNTTVGTIGTTGTTGTTTGTSTAVSTTANTGDMSTTTSPYPTSSTTTTSNGYVAHNSSNSNTALAAGLGAGIGFLALLLLGCLIFILVKRRRNTPVHGSKIELTEVPNKSPQDAPALTNEITSSYIFDFKQITLQKQIGQGAFGIVYLGELNSTPVAIKRLHAQHISEKELQEFQAEVITMKKIPPHPNLVLFRGICLEPLCLITDYCDGGSMLSILRSNQNITDETKMKWASDICKGMIHLHHGFEFQVIHRDLAARNILVCSTR